MEYKPHNYQAHAIQHIIENPIVTVAGAGLFIDMGLGKTSIVLTAFEKLIYETYDVDCLLIIAPKRVADDTWAGELEKWDHLQHVTLSKVLGSEKERVAALKVRADVYTINRENIPWLVSYYGSAWPFKAVVIDESTSFKNPKSMRFKAFRMVLPKITRRVILTGTPAPNGLLDLWSQIYILDRGTRLGETYTEYRGKYFSKDPYQPFSKFKIHRNKGEEAGNGYYEQKIYGKIADICISMKAEDYLDLPEKIFNNIDISMDAATRQKYDDFEKEQVLALLDGDEISAVNAGVLTNKLLQFANGAVYDEDGGVHEMHDEKLKELAEIIDEANGKPVLVFYSYRHDADRIKARFKDMKPVDIKGTEDIKKWNRGEIELMMAHPASAGHGLNLQAGGSIIVFFGLLWSLELYLQAIARLHRQGQINTVIVHRLINRGTIDEDVVAALDSKEAGQRALMNAVKARVKKYVK